MDEWRQLWLVEIGLSVVACHAGCRAWTSTLSDDDRGKETVIRDANFHRRWCCELYRRSLQHVDSKLRRGTWMDRRTGQLLVVLSQKLERLLHVVWRYERKRGKTTNIWTNFFVVLVVHFQSDLVDFAGDALIQVEITARHGGVWIRFSESVHSSFLQVHRDKSRIRQCYTRRFSSTSTRL